MLMLQIMHLLLVIIFSLNVQRWGLAGAIMINDSDELPPYEGLITGNPETGEK